MYGALSKRFFECFAICTMQINQLPMICFAAFSIWHSNVSKSKYKIQNGFRASARCTRAIALIPLFNFKHSVYTHHRGADGRRTAEVFCAYKIELLSRTIILANCNSLQMKNLKSGKSVSWAIVFSSFSNETHLFRCTFCSFIKSVHSSSYFDGISKCPLI